MNRTRDRATLSQVLAGSSAIIRLLGLRETRLRDRLRLMNTAIRAWTRRGTRDHRLSFPGAGTIELLHDSMNADWNVFSEVFLTRCYETRYRDSTVVDIGAHKGYFAAFALLGGARRVISFEPESRNFNSLERAARSFRHMGFAWHIEKKALAAHSGEVELRVSGESWTHSLLPLPEDGHRRAIGIETVVATTLDAVVEEVNGSEHGRVIVKVDVEGAECEIIFSSAQETWSHIDELFVETHPHAECSGDEICSHLSPIGLDRQPDSTQQITHLKR